MSINYEGLSVCEAFNVVEVMHQYFYIYIFCTQAMKFVTDALSQDSGEVRAAACVCLKNVSRSVKVCNVHNSLS